MDIAYPFSIFLEHISSSNGVKINWFQMDAMSRGELLPKVVEAYSRPTRIVRGKDVEADMEVFVTFCLLNLIRNLFLRT